MIPKMWLRVFFPSGLRGSMSVSDACKTVLGAWSHVDKCTRCDDSFPCRREFIELL